MNDQIICPNCKKSIPLTEAFSHQLKEQNQEYVEKLRDEARKWKEEQRKKMEIEQQEQQLKLQKELKERIQREMELRLRDSKNEAEELKKQNQAFQEQILEMNKLVRQLRAQDEQRQIEMEKKMLEEQEKIKEEAKKQVEEANRLKMLEMDKKLHDALKVNEELKRKLEQGSQQMQGEVLELELEKLLKQEFPYDEIKEVPKGVNGADIIQVVKNNYGKAVGSIAWEFKRTKAWSNEWVTKLKDDQRLVKADVGVLITQVLPPTVRSFGMHEGVWVGEFGCVIGLAAVLRSGMLRVAMIKSAVEGNNEKKDILWNYLTSAQFTNRMQAIADVYTSMRDDLEKEKVFFKKKWAKQELSIQKITDSIYEMHGELEGIMGKELAEIKGLDVLPDGKENAENTLFETN